MSSKCSWSHEVGSGLIQIHAPGIDRLGRAIGPKEFWVKPEYRSDLEAYCQRTVRLGRVFIFGILGLSLAMIALAVLGPIGVISKQSMGPIIGALLALMGALIIWCPFTTPETQDWVGIRTSITVGRACGVVTVVLGVVIAILA